jgi:hypothetical protein
MNTKTFEAIEKLKDVELELHRLKNALEMANKALDAQRTWVGLTDKERNNLWREIIGWGDPSHDDEDLMKAIEDASRRKNT